MPQGKAIAQAGHCYVNAYIESLKHRPDIAQFYQHDGIGTKICLKASNENQILLAYQKAKDAGLPSSLIIDQHHTLLPHFTGEPIITGLGIGPCKRNEIHFITKKFSLYGKE